MLNDFWIIQYMLDEEERRNKEEEEDGYYPLYVSHEPTKMDDWLEKHPLIDCWWPIVLGTFIGLLPAIIPYIIYKLFMI